MRTARFKQVDVFTDRPFHGNPVAVVLEADGLSPDEMQCIAAWTNLSETTFVLPSEVASYRLRIFTPAGELPFAGHPTLGSAHAVIESGLARPEAGLLTQECSAGVIPVRVADGLLSARVPAPQVLRDRVVSAAALSEALRMPVEATPAPLAIEIGPIWLVSLVPTADALMAATPDRSQLAALSRDLDVTGVTAFALDPTEDGARIQVRSFAPAAGIDEDPVCGSGNAAVGAFLGVTRLLSRTGGSYVAAQGEALGRVGRVRVDVRGPNHIEIGGRAVTVLDGTIRLD